MNFVASDNYHNLNALGPNLKFENSVEDDSCDALLPTLNCTPPALDINTDDLVGYYMGCANQVHERVADDLQGMWIDLRPDGQQVPAEACNKLLNDFVLELMNVVKNMQDELN